MSISNNNPYQQLKPYLCIEVLVPQWLPDGKREGHRWVSRNPTRNDNKPGSFKINMATGEWGDFASGDTGGDLISLYGYLHRVSNSEALKILEEMYGPVTGAKPVKKVVNIKEVQESYGNLLYPAPDDCGKPDISNDGIWCYKNIEGRVLQYVLRFNQGNGKITPPYTYREKGGTCRWVKKGAEGHKKPLYGMEKLVNEGNILLVEGEKTCDAAQALLPEYICMSWMGGSNSVAMVDWEHLRGRVVYLWPDNDKAGFEAMANVKELLGTIAAKISVIDIKPMGDVVPGWDLADAGPEHLENIYKCLKPKLERESFPDLSAKFNILNTTDNIEHLLKYYNVVVKYNLMTNYPEFRIPGKSFSSVHEADCYLVEMKNLCVKNSVPKVDIESHVRVISDRNCYHPARDFIESKPWDGVQRLNDFIATVEAEKQSLANVLIYRWMLGCVAAAYSSDGISLEGMLVFQGRQRVGKTYWFIKLVPPEWRHLIQEAVVINPDNKDLVIEGTSIWLGELGELNGVIRKADIESMKNFITRSKDVYRVPFGKQSHKVPRRSSYFGSVNNETFLADETGNRRYWTIAVNEINYNHNYDMQQVWAQVKHHLDAGESYRLTEAEQDLVNIENESFKHVDPLEEIILSRFDWDDPYRNHPMSATDVLIKLGIQVTDNNRKKLSQDCGAILTKLTGKKWRQTTKKKVYDMPNFIIFNPNL